MEPAPYLTPAPPARSSRLGRSAWLVFGGGLLLLALTVGFGFLAEPYMRHEEVATIAVIGLLSGGVFTLWSIVLAIRALWAGERQTLPILLLLFLAAVLMGGFGVACWFDDVPSTYNEFNRVRSWPHRLFLPVILPFVFFVCLTGVPLILWLLRRRKRILLQNGAPELSRRESWRFVLPWAAVYALLCGVILIPMPLFVMCVKCEGGIRTEIVAHTPDFFRDATEALLYRFSGRGTYGPLEKLNSGSTPF